MIRTARRLLAIGLGYIFLVALFVAALAVGGFFDH